MISAPLRLAAVLWLHQSHNNLHLTLLRQHPKTSWAEGQQNPCAAGGQGMGEGGGLWFSSHCSPGSCQVSPAGVEQHLPHLVSNVQWRFSVCVREVNLWVTILLPAWCKGCFPFWQHPLYSILHYTKPTALLCYHNHVLNFLFILVSVNFPLVLLKIQFCKEIGH